MHTDRQTYRCTDIQTGRRDRQTYKQTDRRDRQTYRPTDRQYKAENCRSNFCSGFWFASFYLFISHYANCGTFKTMKLFPNDANCQQTKEIIATHTLTLPHTALASNIGPKTRRNRQYNHIKDISQSMWVHNKWMRVLSLSHSLTRISNLSLACSLNVIIIIIYMHIFAVRGT